MLHLGPRALRWSTTKRLRVHEGQRRSERRNWVGKKINRSVSILLTYVHAVKTDQVFEGVIFGKEKVNIPILSPNRGNS